MIVPLILCLSFCFVKIAPNFRSAVDLPIVFSSSRFGRFKGTTCAADERSRMPPKKAAATTPSSGQRPITAFFSKAPSTPATPKQLTGKELARDDDDDDFCIDFAMDEEKPVAVKPTVNLLRKPTSTPQSPSLAVSSSAAGSSKSTKPKENKLPKKGGSSSSVHTFLTPYSGFVFPLGPAQNGAKRIKREILDSPEDAPGMLQSAVQPFQVNNSIGSFLVYR